MPLQALDCSVAFLLVSRGDYEDEGLVLRPRLEEFIDEAFANGETDAAASESVEVQVCCG